MKTVKHWQDPVSAMVGVWLIVSPWALGFQGEMSVVANALAVGALLVGVALGATFVPRAWEEWTEGALGLWLIASPWLLGFAGLRVPTINAVGTGVVVALLALWVLLTDEDFKSWTRNPTMR